MQQHTTGKATPMDDEQQQQTQPDESKPNGPDQVGDDAPAETFDIVTVTWEGKSWNVPKDRGRWDMNVQFEFEEGNETRGLLILLGGSAENVYKARAEVYDVCKTKAQL